MVGWLGPCVLLIVGIVLWPLFETIRAAFQKFSLTGRPKGWIGFDNFRELFSSPDFLPVLGNTAVWVVGGVLGTTLLALPMAQLLTRRFPGRGILEAVLVVPWAASVVMTAIAFRWILNYYYGVLNPLLQRIGAIDSPVDWLANPATARPVMIAVVIFVSLPFTTFALFAGLRAIPEDVYEAAAVDGASAMQTYRRVTIPLLRGPLGITVILNTLWIFNSFPIVYVLNKSNPGYGNDTTITYMYKLAFLTEHDIGLGSAMAVVNLFIAAFAVAIFLRTTRTDLT